MSIKNVIKRNKAINMPSRGTRKAGMKLGIDAGLDKKSSRKSLRNAVQNLKNDQTAQGVKGTTKQLKADRRSAIKAYKAGGKIGKPLAAPIRNAKAKMLKTARKLKYGYN